MDINIECKSHPEYNGHVCIRDASRHRGLRLKGIKKSYTLTQIINLYGTVCHVCSDPIDMEAPRRIGAKGWQHGLHIDHVLPVGMGGTDTIENLRPTHGICNLRKGNRKTTK